MDELAQRVLEASRHIEAPWSGEKADFELGALQRRLHRRRRVRRVAAIVVTALVLTVALSGAILASRRPFLHSSAIAEGPERAEAPSVVPLRFDDGSTATPLDGQSELVTAEVDGRTIAVRLERGAAQFEVTPRPERTFRVEAGEVVVEVLGTSFTVDRRGERVVVTVQCGRVRVSWPTGEQLVHGGSSGLFPPALATEASTTVEEAGALETSTSDASASGSRPAGWRGLAERGEFDEAYEALNSRGGQVGGDMESLLLAADASRLSGHPGQAARYLRRALDGHPNDPRAGVAAFTLGRVLLNQMGQPRQAAQAFRRARSLAPRGALAEDALAREVEALSRGGAQGAAARRASEYLELYPSGRRAGAVRRHGGLE